MGFDPMSIFITVAGVPELEWASTGMAHRPEALDHCSPVGRVDDGGLRAYNLIFHLEDGGR